LILALKDSADVQDELYYISFDPDMGLEDASPIDADIISCRSIEAYYIK